MSKLEKADSSFLNGFNCSQSIFSSYSEDFGLDRKTALRISTGFGAGMGYLAKTCGAVSGAIMVIGLKYGRDTLEDIEAKEKAYNLVREFVKRFIDAKGSILCKKLLKADISTNEGKQYAIDNNLFREICPDLVKKSVEILDQILNE